MAQADSKVLVLGALAGVAGIGLAAVWYQGRTSGMRGSMPWLYPSGNDERATSGLTVVDGPGLPHGGQAEVLERLEALIQCVSELKDEMKALKNALPLLQDRVRVELGGAEGGSGTRSRASPFHRTTPTRRKRAAAGARAEGQSSEEAESEGGYITALTDSEEEAQSDAGSGDEEEPVEELSVQPVDELAVLLESIDRLRKGTDTDKRECLATLLEKREQFGQRAPFLWRLIRAYSDLHDTSTDLEEKKSHAETGKNVGEEAVALNPNCAESHQWYAIMCGVMAEYETVQNRIKNGYKFKDHLDKAIELNPQAPMSYYLLGRWCYAVAQLSWIERKVAATLFGEPPSATVQDALDNFLKVEEIQPKYSKYNYVFLAKDEEAQKELNVLLPLL
ncbi:regulator of microtubule dynamics protein 2 [Aplochiton taeniatus]